MNYKIECNMTNWPKPRPLRVGRKVMVFNEYGAAQAEAMRQRDRWPGLKAKVVVTK